MDCAIHSDSEVGLVQYVQIWVKMAVWEGQLLFFCSNRGQNFSHVKEEQDLFSVMPGSKIYFFRKKGKKKQQQTNNILPSITVLRYQMLVH